MSGSEMDDCVTAVESLYGWAPAADEREAVHAVALMMSESGVGNFYGLSARTQRMLAQAIEVGYRLARSESR